MLTSGTRLGILKPLTYLQPWADLEGAFFSWMFNYFFFCHLTSFNPFSPNSDQHLISPHNITGSSNIQVTRMNEMITKDGMS